MKNAGCWNSFQKHLSGLVAFTSLFLVIESAVACTAPPEVCEWKKKIVRLKTKSMVASGILINEDIIITNRHVVEDHQSVLVRNYDGNIDSAGIIPHNIQVDLAILVRDSKRIASVAARDLSDARSQTLPTGHLPDQIYAPTNPLVYENRVVAFSINQ